MPDLTRIIRYPNRKMYIPKQGYVDLGDLLLMVKKRQPFVVVSYATGDDMTCAVLARMLVLKADAGYVRQDAVMRALRSLKPRRGGEDAKEN